MGVRHSPLPPFSFQSSQVSRLESFNTKRLGLTEQLLTSLDLRRGPFLQPVFFGSIFFSFIKTEKTRISSVNHQLKHTILGLKSDLEDPSSEVSQLDALMRRSSTMGTNGRDLESL